MRYLLTIFALSFLLVACDEATTAPASAEDIPGPGENPRLAVTVLTGTKAAPVDSPTVKVQWWYKDTVKVTVVERNSLTNYFYRNEVKGSGDAVVKLNCGNSDSLRIKVSANDPYTIKVQSDTLVVYCKAP